MSQRRGSAPGEPQRRHAGNADERDVAHLAFLQREQGPQTLRQSPDNFGEVVSRYCYQNKEVEFHLLKDHQVHVCIIFVGGKQQQPLCGSDEGLHA